MYIVLTSSTISRVCAAERQNLARDSMMGVAGNPTTTVPRPRFKHSRLNALQIKMERFTDHVL